MHLRIGFIVLLLFGTLELHCAEPKAAKKLIEFGWDEPDTAFMREHIAEMEKTPFDGCVFHVVYKNTTGSGGGDFIWDCWGTRAFTREEVKGALEDLKATKFTRF